MSMVLLKEDNKLTHFECEPPAAERFAPLQFTQIVGLSGLFCSFWVGVGVCKHFEACSYVCEC